jgi:hypothetical protein
MPVHEDESPTNTSSMFSIESTSLRLSGQWCTLGKVVAVVSAAAIGGARHAIEMIACMDQEKMIE